MAHLVAYPLGTGRLWVRCSAMVSLACTMLGLDHRVRGHARKSASKLGFGLHGSMLDPNRVIAKDVKSCTYCCYVRYATLIVRVGGNALAQKTGATHYHAQLGPPGKGRAIKGLVVC